MFAAKIKRNSSCKSKICRKASPVNSGSAMVIQNHSDKMNSPGIALPQNAKRFMESRFGADFSNVRIHTGSDASKMSEEMNARAFTRGNDIYFNKGRFNPETYAGMRLLAHELTHVVQQSNWIQSERIQRSVDEGKEKTDTDLCEDWELDFESITIAAAKHFFRTEEGKEIMVNTVKCDPALELIMCDLTLSDGIIVNVHFNPKRNMVRVQYKDATGKLKYCRYSYNCTKEGNINFTRLSCG